MVDLNNFYVTDDVTDNLAAYHNRLVGGAVTAEFSNTETISSTKSLADVDCQVQLLTPSGANRNVLLPPEASTNHFYMIENPSGSTYSIVVKDDSGATTFCTLIAGEWAFCIPTGDAWQVIYSRNVTPPTAENNAFPIFQVSSPGGVSAFVGTINGAPSGASVAYNVSSGTEGAMVPSATTHLAKMRLYNTTRSNYALISNCNTGTNTITLTGNAPANWANGDTITIASQTVSGGGFSWVDLDITSGPMGKTALFLRYQINGANVGDAMRTHPLETFGSAKLFGADVLVANQTTNVGADLVKMTSNVFSLGWTGTPTTVTIREAGYIP